MMLLYSLGGRESFWLREPWKSHIFKCISMEPYRWILASHGIQKLADSTLTWPMLC